MILISQAALNYFCGRLASRRATDKIRRKDKLSELLWMLNAGGKWIYSPRSYVSGIRAALKKGRSQSARRPEDMEIFRKGGLCLGVWKEVTFRIRKGQLIELIRKQAMEISGISCTFQEINNWLKEKKLQHLPSESKMLKGDHSACSLCHMYISVSSLISMLFLRELLIWRLYSYKKSKNNPGIACSCCNFANCVEFQNPTTGCFHLAFSDEFCNFQFWICLFLQLIGVIYFNKGPEFRQNEKNDQIRAFIETAKEEHGVQQQGSWSLQIPQYLLSRMKRQGQTWQYIRKNIWSLCTKQHLI